MLKKIGLRVSIAAVVLLAIAAITPAGSSTVLMRALNRNGLDTNATRVAFSPATNPAFKVNGFDACASGRTGHLWVPTTITATAVKNPQTDEVHVNLAGRTYVLVAPNFETTVPTSDAFSCDDLNGSSLPYTAESWANGSPQNGNGSSGSGAYTVTQID
jgi:hypothetical protein